MRLILTLILAASLAGLSGCKTDQASKSSSEIDSGPGGSTQIPSTTPAAGDNRPTIVCFGDSLTAGYGADQSYPDFLQQDLDRQGFHYHVVNEGVSGNTTKDGIDRLPDVLALKPAVVIVEFGGNDGLRGFKTEVTHANLSHILSSLKASGTQIILAGITLPPDYGPDYIKAFDANYSALAKQYNVPLIPFLLKDVYGVPGLMQADNIHATNKGNAIMAHNIEPLLLPDLKK